MGLVWKGTDVNVVVIVVWLSFKGKDSGCGSQYHRTNQCASLSAKVCRVSGRKEQSLVQSALVGSN